MQNLRTALKGGDGRVRAEPLDIMSADTGDVSMRAFWFAFLVVGLAGPARADWLTAMWRGDADARNGSPAITLNAAGAVAAVLPEAVLAEARATGLTIEDTVGAFLARYAPKMCSSLLDMNAPHPNLKVDLFIQRPVALDSMDGSTQEDVAAALNQALKAPMSKAGSIPRIKNVFMVGQSSLALSIDYAPEKKVDCVESPDAIF